MTIHWVKPKETPRIELARPEVECGETCSIIVLSLAECNRKDHIEIFHELEEKSLACYFRNASIGDTRRIFVLPREKETTELWNKIERAFGQCLVYEKVL